MNAPPAPPASPAPAAAKAGGVRGAPAAGSAPADGLAAVFAAALGQATPKVDAAAPPAPAAKAEAPTTDGSAAAAALVASLAVLAPAPVAPTGQPAPTPKEPVTIPAAGSPIAPGAVAVAPVSPAPSTTRAIPPEAASPIVPAPPGPAETSAPIVAASPAAVDLAPPASATSVPAIWPPAPPTTAGTVSPAATGVPAVAQQAEAATQASPVAAAPRRPVRSAELQQSARAEPTDRPEPAVSGSRPAPAHPRIAASGRTSDGDGRGSGHEQAGTSPFLITTASQRETSTTDATGAPTTPGGIDRERFDRLVDGLAARLKLSIAGDGARVRMNLEPRELGEIVVRLQIRGGIAQASLITDNPDATRMLQGTLTDLRSALADRGVQLDRVDVRTSGDPTGDRRQQPGQDAGSSDRRQTSERWRFGRIEDVSSPSDPHAPIGVRHGQPVSLLA